MSFVLDNWTVNFPPGLLREVADLWNRNSVDRHSFRFWNCELLQKNLFAADGSGIGAMRAARTKSGNLAGILHANIINDAIAGSSGVIEMLLVDRPFRRQGLGGRLLGDGLDFLSRQKPGLRLVDAMGAWPYGFAYNSLADGSERSGVFLSEPELYRLFRRAGFMMVRKSIVMRADLSAVRLRRMPPGTVVRCSPRREETWLDQVFRGRDLWDHNLALPNGDVLSRAVFAFMDGESEADGRALFSLFGVNTSPDRQRRGYASVNLSRLMEHVASLGGEFLEIHVYADNHPAVALYRGLGFRHVAETAMLHRIPPSPAGGNRFFKLFG
jgi:ribosomal protein S18 acetylase RimI-like enzyme